MEIIGRILNLWACYKITNLGIVVYIYKYNISPRDFIDDAISSEHAFKSLSKSIYPKSIMTIRVALNDNWISNDFVLLNFNKLRVNFANWFHEIYLITGMSSIHFGDFSEYKTISFEISRKILQGLNFDREFFGK